MVTIMQFSDLHMNGSADVSNSPLISSIVSDMERYHIEQTPIPKPDLLVVCGDLIQGVGSFVDFDSSVMEIKQQYSKANDFLSKLCEILFDGDKRRVVIIPGNHDVSWPHSHKSMEKLNVFNPNFINFCKKTEKGFRWNWKDHSYYRIGENDIYNQRLLPFLEFYSKFYDDKRHYSLDPNDQYDIFEFPEFNILIVGFNSCYLNDHLNDIGRIQRDCLANCHFKINQEKYKDWLKIAVWHHGVRGFPTRSDFMHEKIVQYLIDKGFHLGLHGHQHETDIFDVKYNVDYSIEMKILGCGTLCADYEYVPEGESREYNLIEIDDSYSGFRIHVRTEVGQDYDGLPIWSSQKKYENYRDFTMKTALSINKNKGDKHQMSLDLNVKDLEEADNLVAKKEYPKALLKLRTLRQENPFVRGLIIECLSQLNIDDELINFIPKPNNVIEFTYLSEALWRKKEYTKLRQLLDGVNLEIAASQTFTRMESKLKDRGY